MSHRRAWVVAASLTVLAACSGGGSDSTTATRPATPSSTTPPAATQPPPAASTTTTAAPLGPASIGLGSVTGVEVDIVADVPVPVGFTPAGEPVDVTVPDEAITEPVQLSLPGTPPPAGAIPLLLHRNDVGRWEAVAAEYVDGHYVAEVMSFSWYWPGWAADATAWVTTTAGRAVDAVGNAVDDAADWLTGRTDPPADCSTSAPYSWVSSASGGPSDGAYHVCLAANPDGAGDARVEVKLKSNRGAAMWVVVPTGLADYVWIEGSAWHEAGAFGVIPGVLDNAVLLGAGRTMTVGFRRPVVDLEVQLFAYQDNLSQLYTLVTQHVGELLGEAGTLIAAIQCAGTGEDITEVSVDRLVACLDVVLALDANRIEGLYDEAVAAGRLALASGDRAAFGRDVLRTERFSAQLAKLKKAAAVLTWAQVARTTTMLAIDAALALAEHAGSYELTLAGTRAAAQPAPTTTAGTLERSAFAGRWAGTVTGLSTHFGAIVTLTVGDDGLLAGTIVHPDLPCTGTTRETRLTAASVELSTTYTAESSCVHGGSHRLTLAGTDQMTYEWLAPDSDRIDSGTLHRLRTLTADAGGVTVSVADGTRSAYSDTYYADVTSVAPLPDHRLSVGFTARGEPSLRRPETSCLVGPDGARATPLATELTVDASGHFDGTWIFPVALAGSWSLRYSCASDYSLAPVAVVDFDHVGVSWFSTSYYATVVSTTRGSTGTVDVEFVAAGDTDVQGNLRDPLTSCLVVGGDEHLPVDAMLTTSIPGTFQRGTLHFANIPDGAMGFRYSCTDYSVVPLTE